MGQGTSRSVTEGPTKKDLHDLEYRCQLALVAKDESLQASRIAREAVKTAALRAERETNHDLERLLQEQHTRTQELLDEIASCHEREEKLHKQAQERESNLRTQMERVRKELEEAHEATRGYKKQLEEANEENKKYRKQLQEKVSELNKAQWQLKDAQNRHKKLETQVNEMEKEKEKAERELRSIANNSAAAAAPGRSSSFVDSDTVAGAQ